jgi:hypothetical protein
MTLFSQLDWLVLIAVAAFFLLGRDSGAILRQLGRWYGRAVNLKRELLSELTEAAGLPNVPGGGGPGSLRAVLLGAEAPPASTHVGTSSPPGSASPGPALATGAGGRP